DDHRPSPVLRTDTGADDRAYEGGVRGYARSSTSPTCSTSAALVLGPPSFCTRSTCTEPPMTATSTLPSAVAMTVPGGWSGCPGRQCEPNSRTTEPRRCAHAPG